MIVGLVGLKQSGKTTIADYLVSKYNFVQLSFADNLKKACQIIFHFTDNQVNGDEKEIIDQRWNKTPRQILQYVGTNLFRDNFDSQIWIKSLALSIDQLIKQNINIVIADVRFINEAKFIQSYDNSYLIRIERELCNSSSDTHASELENNMIDCDYEIKNNKSLTELYKNVQKLYQELLIDEIKSNSDKY
jgi:dephospho-CoA kinase